MSRIIDLGALVAEDIVFKYNGVDYAIPGDIDVDTVFRLFAAFTQVSSIEEDTPDKLAAAVRDRFDSIKELLFDLLKVRQPKLDSYPFGIKSTGIVLQTILSELGVTATAEDPTPPKPPTRKRASSRAK